MHLGDQRVHDLARHLLAQLGLLLGQRRHRLALVDHQDDVPAELRLHRGGTDLADILREGGVGELGHHGVALEVAEIAAIGLGGGIDRLLLGERREVGAALELLDQRVGRSLVRDQDMHGMHLLRRKARLGLHLVVGLLQLLGRGALVDRLLHQAVAQDIVLGARDLGLHLGIVADLLLLGLGEQELAVDHPVQQRIVEHLKRHLAVLVGQGLLGGHEVALLDLRAVDDGDDGICGLLRHHGRGKGKGGQGRGG